MKNLKNKLNKTGGFTLVEMLIVVAIIAILVAVSIPLVSNSLEKARVSTDQANERAAKAEATITYLTGDMRDNFEGYYDAEAGTLQEGEPTTGSEPDYGKCSTLEHSGQYITVEIDYQTGEVTLAWSNGTEEDPNLHGLDSSVENG